MELRKNCINLIRIIAAFNVFYGHAREHLKVDIPDVISRVIGMFSGVPIFFILSGFLIWMSIEYTPDFRVYAKKRIFRLYPELCVGVLLSSITILWFVGEKIKIIPFLTWMFTQMTVFQFWTPDCLRSFGCGTPNGSLWTIGIMVQCYIVVWFLYKVLHKKHIFRWVTVSGVAILIDIFSPLLEKCLPQIIYKLYVQTFFRYIWLFIIGALLYEYIENIIEVAKKYWGLFLSLAIFSSVLGFDCGNYGIVKCLFIAPAIIGFAYKYPKLNIPYDISYGIYISYGSA